ncbi:MAG: bifunctional tetrahydrofolate synthase/dihydrofolate synthase [Gammaproteobacteria bacterium]|nr:bifunctional tetrahydrofolate synthase/dihydrofolate synthase [Gammaproteobacteria bacterium]
MRRSLSDWLEWQERLNPRAIELGLDRSRTVADRLGLLPPACVTATIGGTNGKGSSATLAAGIWQAAGYKVGRYLSPHLLRYNERIAIDGVDASDEAICAAFAAIDAARGDLPLTYFEFGTLAALWLFREARVDVQVLEVGLGGRLDAVNIVDADAALVTNIGLDHTDWLGPDREAIGGEKAGIFRPGRPAICAEISPPASLRQQATRIAARWQQAGADFVARRDGDRWDWRAPDVHHAALPLPALPGAMQIDNAAGVLTLVTALADRLPVGRAAIETGLRGLSLPGRYQRVAGLIVDVAHNLESAAVLVEQLRADGNGGGVTRVVLGMLSDKPVAAVCARLAGVASRFYCAGLPPPRGLPAERLLEMAGASGVPASAHDNVALALAAARADAGPKDRIVVCGSFLTVAAALEEARWGS